MSSASDLNTEAPAAPWLHPALAKLRINQTRGLAPLADRELAAVLLIALECDGPAPEVREYMGGVALAWAHGGRSLIVSVANGCVYASDGPLPSKGRVDRLRGLVAAVRGGCDDPSKGD